MKLTLDATQYANVDILPTMSLKEAADLLGQMFGGLQFERDQGYYEEYPAYVADDEQADALLSLLGIPDPKYEIRKNPSPNYLLIVKPMKHVDATFEHDISEQIAAMINADGRLKAHVPSKA